MKAMYLFTELEKGILHTIKAADIYTIHLVAIQRNEQPNQQIIQDIIMNEKISGLTIFSMSYRKEEKEKLEEKGYLINIGNQIILATYTALEFYLTNKFKECFQYRLKGVNTINGEKTLEKLSFRSLDNIKDLYKDILGIYLPQFEMREILVDEHSSFKPESSWDGIKTIEKARHEIAHEGKTKAYKITILPDVWHPFNFVRRWVTLFDVNFDLFIYEGRATQLIREYQKRVERLPNKMTH
jgi:hypothetical protein